MTPPPALGLRDELVASIDATLQSEARRNEVIIARIRAAVLVALCFAEVLLHVAGGGVPWPYRIPTFGFAAVAVALLVALERGWHHPALGVVLPVFDGSILLVRLQTAFGYHPIESLEQSMELATIVVATALLIVSGAFRLSRTSVVTTGVVGTALYLWFAAQTRLELGGMVVHLVMLVGLTLATAMLTLQVRRAVRSEVARVTLSRFLPATLLDSVHADPIALLTRPRTVQATVLVTDIRGFTAWAEHKSAIEVLEALNVVQGRLAAIVRDHHGMVDKFMGDGMLAVFGAPEPLADHAARAVAAARAMRGAAGEFRLGIAVHTGELVVGCLGSGVRMEFTVLGDTVNTVSRLEGLTKEMGVDWLVSEDTAAALPSRDGLERLGEVAVRGRDAPLGVWTSA